MSVEDSPITDPMVWLDLETTGSDEDEDEIIEIGCVLTSHDLVEMDTYTQVVRPSKEAIRRLNNVDVVRKMHEANGLLTEIHQYYDELAGPAEVEADVIAWLTSHGCQPRKTILAGSGVGHFDRRFLRRHMPELDAFFRYWCIDIGSIRRAHRMWVGPTGNISSQNDNKNHRALFDAQCHLAEAQDYAKFWNERLV